MTCTSSSKSATASSEPSVDLLSTRITCASTSWVFAASNAVCSSGPPFQLSSTRLTTGCAAIVTGRWLPLETNGCDVLHTDRRRDVLDGHDAPAVRCEHRRNAVRSWHEPVFVTTPGEPTEGVAYMRMTRRPREGHDRFRRHPRKLAEHAAADVLGDAVQEPHTADKVESIVRKRQPSRIRHGFRHALADEPHHRVGDVRRDVRAAGRLQQRHELAGPGRYVEDAPRRCRVERPDSPAYGQPLLSGDE